MAIDSGWYHIALINCIFVSVFAGVSEVLLRFGLYFISSLKLFV